MAALPVPGIDASRVLVCGATGSGKSTPARRLGAVSGLPEHEIDALTWDPGWTPVARDVQEARVREFLAGERWVVDHCYAWTIPLMLERARLVVRLDLPPAVSYARLVRRTVVTATTGRPTRNGNVEHWRTPLAKDSMLWWRLRSFPKKRERMRAWAAGQAPEGVAPPPTLLLSSPAQVRRRLTYVEGARRA